jgi:AraC-like DNA-binding protein
MNFLATNEYPGNDPFEVWIDLSAGRACPVEHVRLSADPFEAQMLGVPLGARATVLEITESPHECRRTPRMIARSVADYLAFLVHDGPPGLIEQDCRQTVIQPGQLTFYDLTRPSTLTFPGPGRSDLLLVERDALDVDSRQLAELTARPLPAERGTAAVLRSLLGGLAPRLSNYPAESAARLGSCVIDLAELLLRESLDDPTATACGEQTLLTRITVYLEQQLHDPGLCPEQIAKAHHISTRYLSKLFAAEGTTVMTWVRERRLERCRGDLVDPRLRGRPIAAVAAKWGFLQPAHFSRAFRARYDISPREYRLAAGAQATGVVFDLNLSRNSEVPSGEDRTAHIAGASSKRLMNSSATR